MNNVWLLLHLSPGGPPPASERPSAPVGGMGSLSLWLLVKPLGNAWEASGSWGHRPYGGGSSAPEMGPGWVHAWVCLWEQKHVGM